MRRESLLILVFLPGLLCQTANFHRANALQGKTFTGQYQDTSMPTQLRSLVVSTSAGNRYKYTLLGGEVGPSMTSGQIITGDIVATNPQDGCFPFSGDLGGKVALIMRGTCTFTLKAYHAQQAGAIAVIIYNNVPGYFRMADDHSHTVTIPAMSLLQADGLELRAEIQAGSVQAAISDGGENSVRVYIDYGSGDQVRGTVDFRLTALEQEFASQEEQEMYVYGSFQVAGTFSSSGVLSFQPTRWIVEPLQSGTQHVHSTMFGMTGTVEDLAGTTVFRGGRMPPFDAQFHLRQKPDACALQLSYIEDCTPTDDECGNYTCQVALDSKGYRLFNDKSCSSGQPLVWYCDGSLPGSCAGEVLVPSKTTCKAAGQAPSSLIDFWPRGGTPSVLDRPPGIVFNTSCSHTGASTANCSSDGVSGWELNGDVIWSGGRAGHNTINTLNLYVDIVEPAGGIVSFNFRTFGERRYDFLRFSVDGRAQWETYSRNFETWMTWHQTLSKGLHRLEWSWVKDLSVSQGLDAAFIRAIDIQGAAVTRDCVLCDAGACSAAGVSFCASCPVGMYSSSQGSSTCLPCQNALNDFEHYASDGVSTPVCPVACDKGLERKSGVCVPTVKTCVLPSFATPEFEEQAPPISYAMLTQCLSLTPVNQVAHAKTLAALESLLQFYPLLDYARAVRKVDLLGLIDTLRTTPQTSDYKFHSQLMAAFRSLNDPSLLYTPPQLYHDLALYLPFKLAAYTDQSGMVQIYVDGINAAAHFFGYRVPAGQRNWNVNTYVGWKVATINNMGAETAILEFAATQVGVSDDVATRFNLALNSYSATSNSDWLYWYGSSGAGDNQGQRPVGQPQTMAGQWTCAFTYRNLGLCDMPQDDSVAFTLVNPSCTTAGPECTVTMTLPWSAIHSGWEPVHVDEHTTETMSSHLRMRNSSTPYDCSPTFMRNQILPSSRFWAKPAPRTDDIFGGESRFIVMGNAKLELAGNYDTVTGFVYSSSDGDLVGILELRQLQYEEMALHALLSQFAGSQVNRLVLDVRGNVGGSNCHALQLAYLLSSVIQAVPTNMTAIDFRKTQMFEDAMLQASAATPNSDLFDFLQLRPSELANLGGLQEVGDDWYTPTSTKSFAGESVDFTTKMQFACGSDASLLQFPSQLCFTPERDYWMDPNSDSAQQSLSTHKLKAYGPDDLMVISDGACVGACAVLVQTLQSSGAAKLVTVGGPSKQSPGASSASASTASGAFQSNAASLWCQATASFVDNATALVLPFKGQDLRLPLAALYLGPTAAAQRAIPATYAPAASPALELHPSVTDRHWTQFVLGNLPSALQEFAACITLGHSRMCSVSGGLGQQSCTQQSQGSKGSPPSYFYSKCTAVVCSPGFYLQDGACYQVNAATSVRQMKALLSVQSPEAAAARKELRTFLDEYDGGSAGGSGVSPGAAAALALSMLVVGAVLTVLFIVARSRYRAGYSMDPRQYFRRVGSPPTHPRGGGVEPISLSVSAPSAPPPSAEGRSGFLAQLQTRKSRGSIGERSEESDGRPMLQAQDDDDSRL